MEVGLDESWIWWMIEFIRSSYDHLMGSSVIYSTKCILFTPRYLPYPCRCNAPSVSRYMADKQKYREFKTRPPASMRKKIDVILN